jgi:deoxyribodipyrimidine photo-lyase
MTQPALLWLRRELRLADNAALAAAAASGRPVLPVFILDETTPGPWAYGGAARWWLHHSLAALAADLAARGASLVLRRGPLAAELPRLVAESGAAEVHAGQPVEPWARDALATLAPRLGAPLVLHRTATLFDLTAITTGGRGYRVFTPFARACLAHAPPPSPVPAPARIPAAVAPRSDRLDDWGLLPRQPDWAGGLRAFWQPGEATARARLRHFVADILPCYHQTRNLPHLDGTSRLSAALHWGEISPTAAWHAAAGDGPGAAAWRNELLWREFSAHLLWHNPDLPTVPLRSAFAHFPWCQDRQALAAWRHGRTGVPIVDAGMRQLWQTGWMHNRVRMIVASFLVKHLLQPWQAGAAWFWDTLVDADLASNSAQWQWVAGCGTDAAPYFRIFNPVRQGETFDPDGAYVRAYVPEVAHLPAALIHRPWEAGGVPGYPPPLVDLPAARARALAAWRQIGGTA